MINLIIVDASGSMGTRVSDVKGGLKQMFADIRKQEGGDSLFKKNDTKGKTIVVDFSDDFRVLAKTESADSLKDDIADNYSVRGGTALYDAIGKAFSMIEEDETKVFVNIVTDGEENASREWSSDKIKNLIAAKKEKGWAILFVGASEDCVDKAISLGISAGNTMTFSPGLYTGTKSLKAKLGRKGYDGTLNVARAMYMSTDSMDDLQLGNLMDDAEKFREKRDEDAGMKEDEI